ncbi:thiamine biosynthesis protein ThiF [Jiella pacifica]|uniref:Thiamine biosynthesis protein ThiF n=1 Tax=Jiella pacifica TaxID=2696469 RepID=A0A6N9T618_9HYPH|nr:thiamine biosynthesis protein ThiF [Jiella pacifica]MAU94328.1 thiamine biosynthesis protein ThiF [Fulvimarina sp.]NDW06751.1 thiamine biosynthesis protein ThiF [Jiella pacifica]
MTTDPDHLHRTAKYFMDSGRAATADDAVDMLSRFGLAIRVDPATVTTVNGQVGLLTLVNAARRTMLGGIEVEGVGGQAVVTKLATEATLREAVEALGGTCVEKVRAAWPRAIIGDVGAPTGSTPAWRLQWAGWRGGVIPSTWPTAMMDDAISLAPALAAAACVGEVFAWHAGDHDMAGRRASGLSIWDPGKSWMEPNSTEPALRHLPTHLWFIGLGNLGQAFAWALASLPYPEGADALLMLQDFDSMAVSNDSTSLLAVPEQPTVMKTRWVGDWLQRRGFDVRHEERRFGAWTRRHHLEPGAALCGVDNAAARAALEEAGFDLVVEAGLGAGTQGFRNFSLHSFPGPKRASVIWGGAAASATAPDVSRMPAYEAMKMEGVDGCGLAQIASRTIGVPFVGLTASVLAVGELLRRLHGGGAMELVSGSLMALDDTEAFTGAPEPYAHGHLDLDPVDIPKAA